ncbi:alpha/beta fold hydrolase [Microbacterium sp. ZW T5_56]|uniref:alpha/beta fold hydrolase n=1 Tax=Microbacterium sp. ZW T5_56 TaxID=3378081 RepID=UPI003851F3C5
MRKPLKVTLITLGSVLAIPVVLLGTTFAVNAVATRHELASIKDYGQRVDVDGHEMNVVITGTGDDTIVLLPGLGTASPWLDYQPLVTKLEQDHRVVVVEPFGYGLSDQTDVPRTTKNIVEEVHTALQEVDITRYTLMGHSIAGLYALTYAEQYRDELRAFVGIDTSVPNQPGWDDPTSTAGITDLRNLGITRALSALSGDPYAGLPYSDDEKQQMGYFTTRNASEPTVLNELENASANFGAAATATFPADLPVLLFIATQDGDFDNWKNLHDGQVARLQNGSVVPLDGTHYLHHTQSETIAQDTDEFLSALPVR